jgi:hypothetical protein
MNLRKKHLGLYTLLLISIVMAACTPTPTPAPTVDVNALYTQAAVTMIAQLTQNAPTITPTVPATNTPAPSATPLGLIPTLPGLLPTLPPLATSTGIASATGDKALYVTQSPSDNTSVKTNQTFNIIWRLRNTGTTTWNTQYVYRYYSASNKIPTSANGYNLPQTVAPNQEVELKVVATAPSSAGTYDTRWVITNPEGVNFASFDLTVNVVQGSSSGGVSATATGVPNACSDINYAFSGGTRAVNSSDPAVLDDIQGGQGYLSWSYDTGVTTTGTFGVCYGPASGACTDVLTGKSVATTGGIWVGSPDTETHQMKVTVTGTGTLFIKFYSYNADLDCR